MSSIVLSVKEIIDLASFAGLHVDFNRDVDVDIEIRIFEGNNEGLYCPEDSTVTKAKHFMCYDEHPEEGCLPLGDSTEEKFDPLKRTYGMHKKLMRSRD